MKAQCISIITPCFNSSDTIAQTISSVLDQTYKNWELIIIDDCSSDSSYNIALKYSESNSKIKVIRLNSNIGVAEARNIGLDNASGEFVAFLDSDDYWHPEKLEKQILFFKNNDIDVVFSGYYRFNSSGIVGEVKVPNKQIQFKDLLGKNCIGNLTGIYDFKKYNSIRQKKVGAEDYLFWLEVFSSGNTKGMGISEPLAYYRVAEKGKSLSGNKFKSALWTWNIYYNQLNLDFIRSLYYFSCYIYFSLKKRISI